MRNPPLIQKVWLSIGLAALPITGFPWMEAGVAPIASLTAAQAAPLGSWQFDPATHQLEVTVPQGIKPQYYLVAEPARIVLDLPSTQIAGPSLQSYEGAVRQVRVAQFQSDATRIVLELAPDTVLASGQVELQRVGSSERGQNGDRWMLRPLLATDVPNTASLPVSSSSEQPASADRSPAASVPTSDSSPSSNLPPLEPGAQEIPVEMPARPSTAPAISTLPQATSAPQSTPSTAAVPIETAEQPKPSAIAALPPAMASQPPVATQTAPPGPAISPQPGLAVPALPPANSTPAQPNAPAAVSVPPLSSATAAPSASRSTVSARSPVPLLPAEDPTQSPLLGAASLSSVALGVAPPTLPPSTPTASQNSGAVSVPPLQSVSGNRPTPAARSGNSRNNASQSSRSEPAASSPSALSNFPAPAGSGSIAPSGGNPAPQGTVNTLPPAANASSNILLPSGTVLSLRYPGETPLELSASQPRQEVLLLDKAIHDRAGNVLAPVGSPVIGRFETGSGGSQFIVQAINVQGQNVLLKAESERLGNGHQVAKGDLLRNSAIGAVAGTILGSITGIGLIAGIAAGAASSATTTYFTSPHQPAVIQPNQVVEVHLTENILQ
jgi:hypothetical protein